MNFFFENFNIEGIRIKASNNTNKMKNQELYNLFKNSKLAQVATPLHRTLRGRDNVPSHQIIYTPKSSAIRSNFGIKTALPKQIGFSHIVYNDIDNPKNMPDVESYSGPLYNRLKFQETGVAVKNYFNENNPLFPSKTTKSTDSSNSQLDSVLSKFNLTNNATGADVKRLLQKNPALYKKFQAWLVKNSPESVMSNIPSKIVKLLKEFLATTSDIKKQELGLIDLSKKEGRTTNRAPTNKIQGTGGFSYTQKGRLANSPNGIRHGSIAPGRMVGDREAAIGGFIASVNDRTTLLQNNYSKNYPGKHPRQFVMPFKINEAEITENGRVKVYADGIKVGSWMQRTNNNNEFIDRSNYEASNPNFGSASERNSKDNIPLESLLNLIGNSKK